MNRRALQRLTKRLSARRIAAKRSGKGAMSAKFKRQLETVKGLMRP